MGDLQMATIVSADPERFRATVRLARDGRLLDRVRVNGRIPAESLTSGQACLVAVLDADAPDDALVVSTQVT